MGFAIAAKDISKNSHGGIAITGAGKTKFGITNSAAHRIGDLATCPFHGPVVRLMTGSSNVIVENRNVGTITDRYNPPCGASVTTGVNNIKVG